MRRTDGGNRHTHVRSLIERFKLNWFAKIASKVENVNTAVGLLQRMIAGYVHTDGTHNQAAINAVVRHDQNSLVGVFGDRRLPKFSCLLIQRTDGVMLVARYAHAKVLRVFFPLTICISVLGDNIILFHFCPQRQVDFQK